MELSKSPKNCKLPEANEDRISNLPSIATDKILKRLPIPMVARMSVLSTEWRDKWVSFRYLVFDEAFWKGQGYNATRVNNAIINILLQHNGPLHKFHLHIPKSKGKSINLNQYLSVLSKTCVKKVVLKNLDVLVSVPYHLFRCKELVKLQLKFFILNPPPSGFKGFANLRSLVLISIALKCDILGSLITNCPRLKELGLMNCTGITNLVIDAPNLEVLVIRGGCASLHFKNVVRLAFALLYLERTADNKALHNDLFNSIELLASSSKVQQLRIGGHMCQLLAAGGVTNSLSVPFNHLKKLCLMDVDLGDLNVFRLILSMIQSCPHVKHLEISIAENTSNDGHQHNIEFNDRYKLNYLTRMKITGFTGSTAELKFLEYVLSISVVLESLYFKYGNLDPNSALKVSNDLLRLRRTSPKAQLVCLDQ